MRFVHKKNSNDFLAINKEEKDILYTKSFSSIVAKSFLPKLITLKDDYWISCDCQPNAFLIICSLNGNIYIRCKSLESHHKNCFFRMNKVCLTYNHKSYSRIKQFNIYKNIKDYSEKSDKNRDESAPHKFSLSKLGQVLFTILEDAGVNKLTSNTNQKIIDQLSMVTKAFNDPKKLIAKNIPLSKYYRYFLTNSSLESSEDFLIRAMDFFPKSIKPFILFSAICPEIKSNSFTTNKGDTFHTKNKISLPSPWININKSAPYFLLTSALLDDDDNAYFHDAFAMPILGAYSLMPVESNYERTALKIIRSVIKPQDKIIIEKPLFDIISDDLRFRPDFILHISRFHTIYIEVLGMNDYFYLAHKERIAKNAKHLCNDYISYKAFDREKEYQNFKNHLTKSINIQENIL